MFKLRLKLDLDLDFILIAITSTLRSYSLCHEINKHTNLELEKINDHEIYNKVDEAPLYFTTFMATLPEREVVFFVVANKSSQGLLIPEMSNVDYFMIIQRFYDKEHLELILKKLNHISDIQVAVIVDATKLKSKENLIL